MKKSKKLLTGGQAAVLSLKKERVKHVFGLIGSATMEMFDALYHEKKIKFIGVRDERTGTHMADGYARASNKPGVILAGQNGPGATNLVTGVAQAKAAFSPVVAIAGSYSTKDKMEDAFQGLDQQSLFAPITKKTWTVKNSKIIPNVLSDAFSLAMKPRRGPVCVNLPRNILAAYNSYNINTNKASFSDESSLKSNIYKIKKASKLIQQAKKLIIIVGAGIKYNSKYKEVTKLAELLNAPMVTTAGHGDAIPFNHKLNAGQMGPRGNPVASKLAREADIILAIGTRLGFNSTFYSYDNINKKAKIIQIEIEKTRGKISEIEESKETLIAFLSEMRGKDRKNEQRWSTKQFSKMKGKLEMPVVGKILHNFGDKRGTGELKWQGLFIEGERGAPVRSVYPGTVIFSDWFRGLGLLIIIKHGDGFMSLYAHNELSLIHI